MRRLKLYGESGINGMYKKMRYQRKNRKKQREPRRAGHEIPLSLFYLKYFAYLFAGILLIMLLTAALFVVMWSNEGIYPARYAEEQVKLAAPLIEQADTVSKELIPELCRYVVFDEEGHILDGDLQGRAAGKAWEAVEGNLSKPGRQIGGQYYKIIRREGEYCVLRFRIVAQYKSAVLRKYLPPPEVLILLVFFLLVSVLIIGTALRFGRSMRRKMAPLIAAADRIQKQDLEFAVEKGKIREINAILQAMEDMRAALRQSLEEQWKQEQWKQEQISALAHDLKTPLTLIRGNADLLADTPLTDEQQEYADCVMENAVQMQNYVQMLIGFTRFVPGTSVCRRNTDLTLCLREVRKQAGRLCRIGQVELSWDCQLREREVYAEPGLLVRALLNLVDNAVEHTPRGGTVSFRAAEDGSCLIFTVSDTGPGFSVQALKRGKEQFYMEDESRTTAKAHYGMGLYIVDTIVRQHDGELLLENDPVTHGACVTCKIPVTVHP